MTIRPPLSLSNRLNRLLPYLVLAILALLFFHKLAFSGLILGRGDVYSYFYPYWTERHEALREGRIPFWTTDLFMGSPLLANSQMGLFYPFNWPLTPLEAPTAITISLLAHLIWGLWGTYRLGRAQLRLEVMPALLAAVLFGLGGYVGAKAENINQLQALAWMPWVMLWFLPPLQPCCLRQTARERGVGGEVPYSLTRILQVGIGLALQLLAGHPQTVFITLVGLGVVAVVSTEQDTKESTAKTLSQNQLSSRVHQRGGWRRRYSASLHYLRGLFGRMVGLGAAVMIALVLAAPQLLPTAELSGQSNRGGGLNPQQAMAFSLNPALIGRGFLPSYDALVFGEYMAYLGVIGLGLAVLGGVSGGRWPVAGSAISQRPTTDGINPVPTESTPAPSTLPFLLLAVVGLFLALGEFNPLYWLLAELPGFSFFRVPARWLALFAFGAALLAGAGAQSLLLARPRRWQIGLMLGVLGGLAASSLLAATMPLDVIGPAAPTTVTWVGWGVAGVMLLVGIVLTAKAQRTQRDRGAEGLTTQTGTPSMASGMARFQGTGVNLLVIAAVVELFLASRVLAYNELVPPDTYTASRFTIRQLATLTADQTPPGRFLSISATQFDPGDNARLIERFRAEGMSDFAIRLALVDTKLREVIAANLPLTWNLASIDGFDGGLLPVGAYTAFTSLMLPPGELRTIDGRLREILARPDCGGACIPDPRWLNLTGTRYLITDKVFDRVRDGIFYDTSFDVQILPGQSVAVSAVPAFESTGLHILYRPVADCLTSDCWPTALVTYADGSQETLIASSAPDALDEYMLLNLTLVEARIPTDILLQAGDEAVRVRAVSLVDDRTGDFQQVTLAPWVRRLSSDIKLYENLIVPPRAFIVNQIEVVTDNWDGQEVALLLMRDPDFDPFRQAIISAPVGAQPAPPDGPTSPERDPIVATFEAYQAESMRLRVESPTAGYLIITDTFYPGWQAHVNGEPAPIYRADVLFRGIPVPAGVSTVVIEYSPGWWPGVLVIGGVGWLLALVGWLGARRRVIRLFGAV